ncbi:hypothetical protein GW17_00004760 [Ensete ventricosum]|nr:hypothetical protein GW17_00004760 [Ensete ventricosum]
MSICHREKGIKISDLDMVCGDVAVHLNEDLFLRTDKKLETISDTTATEGARLDTLAKTSEKNKSSLSIKKHIFAFPEKVCILGPCVVVPTSAISNRTVRFGQYVPIRQLAGTRIARYRAVLSIGVVSAPLPLEIDR